MTNTFNFAIFRQPTYFIDWNFAILKYLPNTIVVSFISLNYVILQYIYVGLYIWLISVNIKELNPQPQGSEGTVFYTYSHIIFKKRKKLKNNTIYNNSTQVSKFPSKTIKIL